MICICVCVFVRLQMGYEAGTGLGRDGEGINRPIEVKLRGGRGALAYYGAERTKQSMEDFPTVDSEEEREQEFKKELQQWKATDVSLAAFCNNQAWLCSHSTLRFVGFSLRSDSTLVYVVFILNWSSSNMVTSFLCHSFSLSLSVSFSFPVQTLMFMYLKYWKINQIGCILT